MIEKDVGKVKYNILKNVLYNAYKYWVTKVVWDMSRVDLDFGCCTVCPILLGEMEIWQNRLGTQATWWNIQLKVNPTHVPDHFCHPVGCLTLLQAAGGWHTWI